jgi:hypothetical protein
MALASRAHILRGRALRSLLHVELDGLAFFQAAEAIHPDFGLVAEQVFPSVIRSDEPETFRIIEPLDFTLHGVPFYDEELSAEPSLRIAPSTGRRGGPA